LRDAADVLGLTVDAVRKRVKRETLEAEKGPDGRLYVFLDTDPDTDSPRSDTDRLISTLEDQLRLEREAHAEARRLLAAALERIPPQLEAPTAPSEPRESPETPSEDAPNRTGPPEAHSPSDGESLPRSADPLVTLWRTLTPGHVVILVLVLVGAIVVSLGGAVFTILSAISGDQWAAIISAILTVFGAVAATLLGVYLTRRGR
jgi:hypothetical protein